LKLVDTLAEKEAEALVYTLTNRLEVVEVKKPGNTLAYLEV